MRCLNQPDDLHRSEPKVSLTVAYTMQFPANATLAAWASSMTHVASTDFCTYQSLNHAAIAYSETARFACLSEEFC